MNLLWRGYVTSLQDFRDDFKSRFGPEPYVHSVIQHCWQVCKFYNFGSPLTISQEAWICHIDPGD